MATLGDPFVDLGTLLNYWPDPSDTPDDRAFHVRAWSARSAHPRRGRRALRSAHRLRRRRRALVRGVCVLEDVRHPASSCTSATCAARAPTSAWRVAATTSGCWPTVPDASSAENGGDADGDRSVRQGRAGHRRQPRARPRDGAGLRRGGADVVIASRRSTTCEEVAEEVARRDGSPGVAGRLSRRAVGRTSTSSPTPCTTSSATSTCWSTTPAWRRCIRRSSTSPRNCSTRSSA